MNAITQPQGAQIWWPLLPLTPPETAPVPSSTRTLLCTASTAAAHSCAANTQATREHTPGLKLPRNPIFHEPCISASYAKKKNCNIFKITALSKLLDKHYRIAFQPGSLDENLGFEVRVLLLKRRSGRWSHNIAPPGSPLSVDVGKPLCSPCPPMSSSSTGASTFAFHQHPSERQSKK